MNPSNATRILYIEDDRAQARIVQTKLQRLGYVVDLAYDGSEGLAKHAAGPYDVLLVDQSLPDGEGLDVIRTLVSEGRLPPTIMVTGTGDENTAVEAMKLGISDYVVKSMIGGFVNYLPNAIERALEKEEQAQDRAQADEALRQNELKFRTLAHVAQDGIFMIDSLGNITFWNEAATRIFGYTEEQVMGKNAHNLIAAPRYLPEYHRAFSEFQKTGQGAAVGETVELHGTRKSGEEFPVELSLSSLKLSGEWHAVAIIRDVTERKRLQQELVQAQKLESIGRLAAGIAHEINTPTQYIGDNTRFLQEACGDFTKLLDKFDRLLQAAKEGTLTDELIAEVEAAADEADVDYLTGETPKAIRQSLEGVDKVANIVRAMKEFSHPGSAEKQAVDLNRAVESTLTVSRSEWKYVADLVTDFDPNMPLVPCFSNELNQVVLNLIVNAAQAISDVVGDDSQGKGTIAVGTRRDGDWAEIRISDTGTGIPEEIRSKVFDHFFTTKEIGKGTGQGLTIARSTVVEKHGGTISFETEVGKGTTFVIRLPITEQPRPQEGSPPEKAEAVR